MSATKVMMQLANNKASEALSTDGIASHLVQALNLILSSIRFLI